MWSPGLHLTACIRSSIPPLMHPSLPLLLPIYLLSTSLPNVCQCLLSSLPSLNSLPHSGQSLLASPDLLQDPRSSMILTSPLQAGAAATQPASSLTSSSLPTLLADTAFMPNSYRPRMSHPVPCFGVFAYAEPSSWSIFCLLSSLTYPHLYAC